MKVIILTCILILNYHFVLSQKTIEKQSPVSMTSPYSKKALNTQCFISETSTQKDSIIDVSKNYIEFDGNGNRALMIVTTSSYNPTKLENDSKRGVLLSIVEFPQTIYGTYTINKNILTFIPEKLDSYQTQTFKIFYLDNSNKINYLEDKNNNKYSLADCVKTGIMVL